MNCRRLCANKCKQTKCDLSLDYSRLELKASLRTEVFYNRTLAILGNMIKGLIIFGTGLYAGVYMAQNYQIDKVEDPKILFEKAQAFVKEKLSGKKD